MLTGLELMFMGLTKSNSGLFSTPGFIVSPVGKGEKKEKKKKKRRKEKAIEKEWGKEGRTEGRKEGRKERRKEGSKEGRIQTIRGKIRRRNFNKN